MARRERSHGFEEAVWSAGSSEVRPLVQRAITRSLSERYESAADEVERIIQATYRVIEKSGTVDPRMREILAEAGLSTQAFYRHFKSKHELFLVVLDDGRHRLSEYLRGRMDKTRPGLPRVRAWIEGMFAQAADPEAASRTRPFIVNIFDLTIRFPEEHQRSIDGLIDLLNGAITEAFELNQIEKEPTRSDARSVYFLTVGPMENHIVLGTRPSRAEIKETVDFAFRSLGARTR